MAYVLLIVLLLFRQASRYYLDLLLDNDRERESNFTTLAAIRFA
jgi:hypothetical protein